MLCNICGSEAVKSFLTSDQKTYWSCSCCGGKFLDKDFLLNSNDEKERYLEHNNEINDPEYRSFLSKLVIPLKEKIQSLRAQIREKESKGADPQDELDEVIQLRQELNDI